MLALVGGAAKAIGGGIVKNVAKDKAKNFITGKKKTVKPGAIKKGDDSSTPGKGGSALAVRPQTSLVPQVTPVSVSEVSSESKSSDDTLTLIKTKVFEINKFLKGSLAQEKASSKKDKKSDEKKKRKKQEGVLEKIAPKAKGVLKKIAAPAKGLFDGIFNFITTVLLGRLLIVLLEKNPNLAGGNLLNFIANMAEKVIDIIIGTLDAFGSFLAFGQKTLDGAKEWLKEHKGNDAVKRFDGLLGSLTNLFNAAVIVGSVFALTGGGPGKKGPKKPTKGPKDPKGRKPKVKPDKKTRNRRTSKEARKRYARRFGKDAAKQRFGGQTRGPMKGSVTRRGLQRAPGRLATKFLNKGTIKAIKGVAKGFGKIPIMGPIIVAVASLLAGEPLGQAVFKGLGAALGGVLGSFIPIPVIGTILGETIGVLVGDMLYSLTMGGGVEEAGAKFMTAIKSALDVGSVILNFFKEGFGRLINGFPTIDVSDVGWGVLQKALATVLPFLDDDKDGKVQKIPDFSILNPFFNPVGFATKLIPHAAASFLPDIFGKDGTAFGESKKAPDNKSTESTGGTGGGASATMPSVSTQGADLRNQTEGSKIAGELGRYLNREGLKWGSGVTEHPEHGGVKPVHTDGSYHYKEQGYRAIDIGGWGPNRFKREGQSGTDDQTKIIAGIQKFNKDKGVKPIEFITEATDPTYHNDHVHIAYGLGGLVRGLTHAMLGEKGKEFVIDNDSYTAIESAFPGIFDIINKEKGKGAVEALMAYTDYEKPEQQMAPTASGGSDSGYSSGGQESSMGDMSFSSSSSGSGSSGREILYKFG